jgi:cell division protein FtsI/penicillin-binding protein 2
MVRGGRLVQIAVVFVAMAGAIAWHLAVLQLRDYDFWEHEAIVARTRERTLPCRRGDVRDCDGRLLATSRTVYDLELLFASLRGDGGMAAGQLLAASFYLTGRRATLAEVLARPQPLLERFAALTVGAMKAIEPGERRADLLTYAAWLAGQRSSRDLVERLRTARESEPCCPGLGEQYDAILERIRGERTDLAALEGALSLGQDALVDRIDEAIAAIDARVTRLLARRDRGPRAFQVERELHKEEDRRERLLVKNVPHAAVFDLAADAKRLPGLVVTERTRRIYPEENDVAPLLVGHVGPPSTAALAAQEKKRDERDELSLQEELSASESIALAELETELMEEGVSSDEEVGKEGLEASFEKVLRGRRGWRRSENSRAGNETTVLEQRPPVGGRDLVLTLDSTLQRAAEKILAAGVADAKGGAKRVYPGAFVLIELPAMKVRVLASNPSPSRAEIAERYNELADDTTTRPLHPRAWKPALPPPPGSSIKPLVAAMALTAGIITPHSTYVCSKDALRARDGGPPIKCEGLHGATDLREALVKSCNHYFAQLAQDAGWSRMAGWLQDFGFGEKSGFTGALLPDGTVVHSLRDEASGTAREEERGQRGLRNLMLLGIGQGKVDATPLQVAAAIGALTQRAWLPPTLIESVGDAAPIRPAPVPLAISDAAYAGVVAAMREVTHPGGTASPSSEHGYDLTPFDLATKTGTPQQGRPSDPDHSWFVGFFPSHAPRYAFAIFLERTGRHGGDAAAPILASVLEDPAFAEIADAARSGCERRAETKAETKAATPAESSQ